MQFPPLKKATLIKRYKRFLADVTCEDGTQITVHCPNTGAMTGCDTPGAPVWLSTSDSKTRKYKHTWELIEGDQGMICIHSALANRLVKEALEAQRIDTLRGYDSLQAEVKLDDKTRLDFVLEYPHERVYVEVKCVTLCDADGALVGQGLFPDAVSDRGRKHLGALAELAQQPNTRAVLLFCVQHSGVQRVSTAGAIDPRYREAMQAALDAGVEVIAWGTTMTPQEIAVTHPLPFSLDPPAGNG